eukprot:NODE_829_length_3870_cov_0.155396.p1 type:complete len:1046 gc:universal NODE_829_length_3870_cov_0.155396:387-3524(+)
MLCNIHSINILIVPLGIEYELFERYFELFKSYSCVPMQDVNNTIDANKKLFVHFVPLYQERNLGIAEFMPQTGNYGIIGLSDKDHNHKMEHQVKQFFELCKHQHSGSLAKCLLFNSENDELDNVTSVPKVGNVNFYVYQLLCDILSEILLKLNGKIKAIEAAPYPSTPGILKAYEDVNMSPLASPTLKDLFSTTTDENRILQLKSSGRTFKLLGDYYFLKGEYQESFNKLKSAIELLKGVDPIWHGGALWSLSMTELMLKVVHLIEPTTFRTSQTQLDNDDYFEISDHVKEYINKINTVVLPCFDSINCDILCSECCIQVIKLTMEITPSITHSFRIQMDSLIIKTNVYLYSLGNAIKSKNFVYLASVYELLNYPRRATQFTLYAIKSITLLKPMSILKSITPLIYSSLKTLGFNENVEYCCGWLYLLIEFINHALATSVAHELHETRAYLAYIGLTRLYHFMNNQDQLTLMQHVRAGKSKSVSPLLINMKVVKPLNENVTTTTDHNPSGINVDFDPFIYNPFNIAKSSANDLYESSIDDLVTVELTLCNPFLHVLNLANLKLHSNKNDNICIPKNISINPKTISSVHLKVIPKNVGTMTVDGCTVNCPELGLNDLFTIKPVIPTIAPTNQKYTGLQEIQRVLNPKDSTVSNSLDVLVVESVPFLKIGFGSLNQKIMIIDGEVYTICIPIQNTSSVLINHLNLSHVEGFNPNLKILPIDVLCWLDTFNKTTKTIQSYEAPKEIKPMQVEMLKLEIMGKPFVSSIMVNIEYGFLNNVNLKTRKLQVPLDITLITFLHARSIDIRPDGAKKDNFCFIIDIENHYHELVVLNDDLQVAPGGCERIELVLPRLDMVKPLPMLNKFEYLQLSEKKDYDYTNPVARESYYYKTKLLDLINIRWKIPVSNRKGRFYLHDLELSPIQIQGILKSLVKISMYCHDKEILENVVMKAMEWINLDFKIFSFSTIQYLKFKFVVYQDCQNNTFNICDTDQVLIQGKMHRLMNSVDNSWSTIVELLVMSQGVYYIKCQVEDVQTQKIITSAIYQIEVE